jgi:hypothetical protein
MAKAEFVTYTEKDLAAIEILKANRGVKLSAKELGIANGTLTSLVTKGNDPREMAAGQERVIVNKEDYEFVCPTCGKKDNHKVYWID